MRYNFGQTVELTFTITPDETPTLTVTAPDGTVSTPAVLGSAGSYSALVDAAQLGIWTYVWTTPNGGDQYGTFEVGRSLVTLGEAKAYMGVTSNVHDAEITRLCGQALGVVENMAGPALVRRQFVERYDGGSVVLLRRYPVVSVQSVGSVANGVTTLATSPTSFAVVNGELGSIASPFRYGTVEVTYTAGLAAVPDEAVDAALVFVSYKYRRNHGGSESYMPAGIDGGVAPPMGTKALHDQISLALGGYARGPVIA